MRGSLLQSSARSIAVVTDSIACIPPELVSLHDISVLPLSFYCAGRLYRDGVDITPSEAYELFLEDPESFKTSAVSPGEFGEVLRTLAGTSAGIVCITVSSRLSAVYDAARGARDMVREEFPETDIAVLDSGTCAAAEGMIVLAAARAAAEGSDLSGVAEAAREVSARVELLAFLDTIRHVYRSGRIPKIASRAGSALNVKPLLTVASGELRLHGVARSRRTGVGRMMREMRGKLGGRPAHIAVMHVYAEEEARELEARISAEFNCAELWVVEFSPLMGYVCGTGTLGVAFCTSQGASPGLLNDA